jgi:hypothetical protein
MASRRLRQRAQARPWQSAHEPPPIDWQALANDLAKREQQQPKAPA